jgi:hypothetical protein
MKTIAARKSHRSLCVEALSASSIGLILRAKKIQSIKSSAPQSLAPLSSSGQPDFYFSGIAFQPETGTLYATSYGGLSASPPVSAFEWIVFVRRMVDRQVS